MTATARPPIGPRPGAILLVDEEASAEFARSKRLTFRVTRLPDRPSYPGWIWLRGYVLNRSGMAVEQREIHVRLSGLKRPWTAEPRPGSAR